MWARQRRDPLLPGFSYSEYSREKTSVIDVQVFSKLIFQMQGLFGQQLSCQPPSLVSEVITSVLPSIFPHAQSSSV